VERGVPRILIANRTLARGEALAAAFPSAAQAITWEAVGEHLSATRLLVNTTTLGMAGQPPLAVVLDRLPDDAVVADLVYVPLETGLLAAARQRGLRRADGLGMLLHQAVRGFSLWFGVTPKVTAELRALVEADLKETAPS
jgi:shikimate dehydrogenase